MRKVPSREQVEAILERIGAPRTSVLKWRARGVPGDWALKLIVASDGLISAEDMLKYNEGGSVVDTDVTLGGVTEQVIGRDFSAAATASVDRMMDDAA